MTVNTNKQRVVIKIGSSSLTSRHGEISRKKLEKLVDEIVLLKDTGYEVVLVSSGAIAAGYRKLGCLERPTTLPEKQAAASIGQGLLMETYSELFLSHGYVAAQILITRGDFSDENRYQNMRNALNVLLERGIIPIVNENDTVTIDRLKFGDNDTLSAKVAVLVNAHHLAILSDIDGLYDSDPSENSCAKLLTQVHNITPEIEKAAGGSGSKIGTGGMKSKIQAVKIAMASGISTFLGRAGTPNIIMDAVLGTAKGTYFNTAAPLMELNEKTKWIAFNSGPKGEIIIDSSSKNRIVEKRESVHSSGILEIKGQFEKECVIRIIDTEGTEIGLGIVQFSSEELHQLRKQNMVSDPPFIIDMNHFVCRVNAPITIGV
ncbi:gamma-glutamyl kinase [Peribacillus asahii]|uniref:Glutamate 5-kinase n=1 Tax=Peribacillus asahii TaxID=228899 RepID=A0A3Q9RGZ1_9BACI|nr:glutamate 5-kinase [Peribacillus asahii]AZV41339.1 gamma-glutamyl kinase [Peribacillus asahii]